MSVAHRLFVLASLGMLLGACATSADPGAEGATTSLPEMTTTSAATVPDTTEVPSDLVSAIRSRGRLICGVDGALPGFAAPDETGVLAGFDVEMCRAMATALFGAKEAVRFVEVSPGSAGDVLRTGEVDLVSSQTARDMGATAAAEAGPVVFFDGVQMMGRAVDGVMPDDPVDSVAGSQVCVTAGASEVLQEVLENRSIEAPVEPHESVAAAIEAFKSGGCDMVAARTHELVTTKTVEPEGAGWVVFPVEALDPAPVSLHHRSGEDGFAEVLDLVVSTLLDAEAAEVTSDTVTDLEDIPGFLEVPAEAEDELGLASNALVQVIRQVGNYGEVYDRHLGSVGLERGVNALVGDGGRMQPPR